MKTERPHRNGEAPPSKQLDRKQSAPYNNQKAGKQQENSQKILSLKVEKLLNANSAVVVNNANGERLKVRLNAPLKVGENFQARIEATQPEVVLKVLQQNLSTKLMAEIKGILAQNESLSETIANLHTLATNLKKGASEPPAKISSVKQPQKSVSALPEQNPQAGLKLSSAYQAVKTDEVIAQHTEGGKEAKSNIENSLKKIQGKQTEEKGLAASTLKTQQAENAYKQTSATSGGQTKADAQPAPVHFQSLLAHKEVGSLLRRTSAVLEGILAKVTLQGVSSSEQTAPLLEQSLQSNGQQLEKKLAELVTTGKQHDIKQILQGDLKGTLAQFKGELQTLLKHPPASLSQKQLDDISSLHKDISQRLNALELNQMLHILNREQNAPYIFQLPLLFQNELQNAVLQYKKETGDTTKGKSEKLTINFFLQLSKLGKMRIDGILTNKIFHGVIGLEKEESVQKIRSGILVLQKSLEARGVTSHFSVRTIQKEQLTPPERTSAVQREFYHDISSLLDLKA